MLAAALKTCCCAAFPAAHGVCCWTTAPHTERRTAGHAWRREREQITYLLGIGLMLQVFLQVSVFFPPFLRDHLMRDILCEVMALSQKSRRDIAPRCFSTRPHVLSAAARPTAYVNRSACGHTCVRELFHGSSNIGLS